MKEPITAQEKAGKKVLDNRSKQKNPKHKGKKK
jgi:hypothetical protein